MIIRKLSFEDIPKIVELVWDQDNYSSLEEAWRREGPWCCTELLKNRYKVFLKYGEVFIYEEDKDILGFIEAILTKTYERTIYLNYIEVKKSERRKGIGRKLIEFISDYYKKKGYERIIVWPDKGIEKFYEKCGFKKWKEYICYSVNLSNMKFNYEYTIRRQRIKEEDILGKEIKSYVINVSEHILVWQNQELKFTFQEKDLYGYINSKPFYIRIAYERANIFVWDLDILNYVLQEAKMAGVTEAKVITWKENKLDFEKENEWFYMIKNL